MKQKIGIIDYHIDEWHANHLREFLDSTGRTDEFELFCAWEESPAPDGISLAQWAPFHGIEPASSIDEVIDRCGAICVLAPSNPETHPRLAQAALSSGKPIYVDKTFAANLNDATRMIDLAGRHNTPFFSSSALRFSTELNAELAAGGPPECAFAEGGGSNFAEYCIHPIEMVVTALGCGAKHLIRSGVPGTEQLIIEYSDQRRGAVTWRPDLEYRMLFGRREKSVVLNHHSNFFTHFAETLLDFFQTGIPPFPVAETIEVCKIRDAALKAIEQHECRIAI